MTQILCKTKGNASPKGKPRVWFACHPADFEKYFEKVCAELFAAHDCAVYYTADMSCAIAEQDRDTDYGSNNLFVIPVTFKLLKEANRTMEEDVPYALEHHIPVLPILMEPGLDELYSRPDKFEKLHYLSTYSKDITEISYREKLKKFMEEILTDDKTAKRIREAFDAYIFLSYRKKDRRYANELMRRIHSYPECRDIAVWYDEFLTPGENFQENIESILRRSRLFALLVTPNLLEEPNGKPNYVMGWEYPAARNAGIKILPIQMEQTDEGILRQKYINLPECISMEDGTAFRQQILSAVAEIMGTHDKENPEHLYLIGLAYLNGIDVEKNGDRGLALITQAAEANLPEAMVRLYRMYESGHGTAVDYRKALYWADRLADYCQRNLGEDHPWTLNAWNQQSIIHIKLGAYSESLQIQKKLYAKRREMLGESHPETLAAMSNLVTAYYGAGDQCKAWELLDRLCLLGYEVLGVMHPLTLNALNKLVQFHTQSGNLAKGVEIQEQIYALFCEVHGEEHPSTLLSLRNVAQIYTKLGKNKEALEVQKRAYERSCKVLGEKHPETIIALGEMADIYSAYGETDTALELQERAYSLCCGVLGEQHPETIKLMGRLADVYSLKGNHKKVLDIWEQVFARCCVVLGDAHPDTLAAMNNLVIICWKTGKWLRAKALVTRSYELHCAVYGTEHEITRKVKSILDVFSFI